jgi:hypothetical protein
MREQHPKLLYEFHVRGLSEARALKQLADHAVKDIKSTMDGDSGIRITVEPEAKNKRLFAVSMSVSGLEEPVIVRKAGKNVFAVFIKVKKAAIRRIHRLNGERIAIRKKQFFKEQYAS